MCFVTKTLVYFNKIKIHKGEYGKTLKILYCVYRETSFHTRAHYSYYFRQGMCMQSLLYEQGRQRKVKVVRTEAAQCMTGSTVQLAKAAQFRGV